MTPRRVSTLDLAPHRRPSRSTTREAIGTVVEVRDDTVAVDLGDGAASPLRAAPGGYVVGGTVRVALDEDRAPVAVLGPARDAREGEHVDVVMPGLLPSGPAELTDADRARFEAAEQAIRDARDDLAGLDGALAALDEHLAVTVRTLPVFSRWMPTDPHPQGTIWYQLNASGQVTGISEQTAAPEGTAADRRAARAPAPRGWRGRPAANASRTRGRPDAASGRPPPGSRRT